jgi:hypothetical protein
LLDAAHEVRLPYREALQRGDVQPDFCFPMTVGASWGRTSETDPAENGVWYVALCIDLLCGVVVDD